MKKLFVKPEIELIYFQDVEVLNISNGMYDVIGDDPYTDLFLG